MFRILFHYSPVCSETWLWSISAGIIVFVKTFRHDASEEKCGLQYKDAGVDIEAGDYLVNIIKPLAKMTKRLGCDGDLGGFGGVFDLKSAGFDKSVLACRTSGVGTKIQVEI